MLQVHIEECQRDPKLRTDYVDRNSNKRGPSDDIRMASSSSCFFLSSSSFFFLQLNCCGLRFGFCAEPYPMDGLVTTNKNNWPIQANGYSSWQNKSNFSITLPETNITPARIFQPSISGATLVAKKAFVWPALTSPCTSSRGTIHRFLQEFPQAFPGMSSDQIGLD